MDTLNVCPTEDAIQAFLDYLVEPKLPARYSIRETPPIHKQQAVAKQVYAVVLLYNYYHRKRHPHLEYLDFEAFCKLALILKQNLKSYLKFMLLSDDTELSDFEKQLSLTEKAVKDACAVSTSLDASGIVPSTEEWPVSKVAVLVIDQRKENCALQFENITEGVWSVIEKDVHWSNCSSDGSIKAKHVNKRKRNSNKSSKDESGTDDGCLDQLAFSAVKEATNKGINQSDLTIIESHVVYSLGKEKTATRFYIMQGSHLEIRSAKWIPIKDVIKSLHGPLVIKSSSQWIHSSVVEYFHLLPYIRIIFKWFLRDVSPHSFQDHEPVMEAVDVNGSESTKNYREPEVLNDKNRDLINYGVIEVFGNTTHAESEMRNEKNVHCKNGTLEAINNGCCNMDVENQSVGYSEKKLMCKKIAEEVQHDAQLKMMDDFAKSSSEGTSNIFKLEVVDCAFQSANDCKGQNVANKNAAPCNMPSSQDAVSEGDHALVIHDSKSKYAAKVQNAIASKEQILSETALRVLHNKRDKLVLRQRNIGDEIAQCDKKIQTILNGGEDDLELKIDLIIEGCNDVCLKCASQERASNDSEDQFSTQYIKENRLSEGALSKQNPCQELDGICTKNNWILPTYQVFPSNGGYQAKVSVKGVDFEYSSVGNACPKPAQARGSAAIQMLAKLQSMSTTSSSAHKC